MNLNCKYNNTIVTHIKYLSYNILAINRVSLGVSGRYDHQLQWGGPMEGPYLAGRITSPYMIGHVTTGQLPTAAAFFLRLA